MAALKRTAALAGRLISWEIVFLMKETLKNRKVHVVTFGCQMNEYDSDRLVRLLSGAGYSETDHVEEADLIFLNTCSIRAKAEQKVYSLLGRLRPLKDANPNLIIAVGGCVAQQEGQRFLEKVPYLDIVLGTHGINQLPQLVEEVSNAGRRICLTDFSYDLSAPPDLDYDQSRIKAHLTIMQGCDNFCSYCVVPYVRGRETSRLPEDILAEARDLLSHGVREITLLGQNVNSYGRGLDQSINFVQLVERAAALPGLDRLRFTTSHPKDFSPELIRAMADIGPLAEHIHLPVQCGSTKILKAMRRGYTRDEYLRKVEDLRKVCPDVALTTDMIVGFPGETDEDFRQTMDLVNEVRYDGMYSFKYSDRPMTKAAKMEGKVEESVKGQRLTELQETQKQITVERNRLMLGQRPEVLVEGESGRYSGQLTGRTRNNKIVNFKGSKELVGKMAYPLIIQAWANSLVGSLEDDEAGMTLPTDASPQHNDMPGFSG